MNVATNGQAFLAKLVSVRNVAVTIIIVVGVLVTSFGILKMPAQMADFKETLDAHVQGQTVSNNKLDVLICLQAKLDTPIRCVEREHGR